MHRRFSPTGIILTLQKMQFSKILGTAWIIPGAGRTVITFSRGDGYVWHCRTSEIFQNACCELTRNSNFWNSIKIYSGIQIFQKVCKRRQDVYFWTRTSAYLFFLHTRNTAFGEKSSLFNSIKCVCGDKFPANVKKKIMPKSPWQDVFILLPVSPK